MRSLHSCSGGQGIALLWILSWLIRVRAHTYICPLPVRLTASFFSGSIIYFHKPYKDSIYSKPLLLCHVLLALTNAATRMRCSQGPIHLCYLLPMVTLGNPPSKSGEINYSDDLWQYLWLFASHLRESCTQGRQEWRHQAWHCLRCLHTS